MKFALITVVLASSLIEGFALAGPGNALDKVREMLGKLKDKINDENVREKEFNEHWLTWCVEQNVVLKNTLKVKTEEKEESANTIEECNAYIDDYMEKISILTKGLSKMEATLKGEKILRSQQNKEFLAAQDDLNEAITMLAKAIQLVGAEVKKHPAALAQIDTKMFDQLVSTVGLIVDSAAIPGQDKEQLVSLIQAAHGEDQDAGAIDAPASTVFKSSSGGILEILENMKEKAETDLDDLQKAEATNKHNYKMVKLQLENQIKVDKKTMQEHEVKVHQLKEKRGFALRTNDLAKAKIFDTNKAISDLKVDCHNWKVDYAQFQKDQAAEAQALTYAQQAITTAIGNVGAAGAAAIQVSKSSDVTDEDDDDDTSFLQVQSKSDLGGMKVANMIKALAKAHHSKQLSQLASRVRTVFRYAGTGGVDPIGKVKKLMTDMILDLKGKLAFETTEKLFCDKNMNETGEKLKDFGIDIDKLGSDFDESSVSEVKSKDSWFASEERMKKITKAFTKLQGIFFNETREFYATQEEMKAGLEAVRSAIKIMRNFYDIPDPEEKPIELPTIAPWQEDPEFVGGCGGLGPGMAAHGCCEGGKVAKIDDAGSNCPENGGTPASGVPAEVTCTDKGFGCCHSDPSVACDEADCSSCPARVVTAQGASFMQVLQKTNATLKALVSRSASRRFEGSHVVRKDATIEAQFVQANATDDTAMTWKMDCSGTVCAKDLCPDGKSRRPTPGEGCCGCGGDGPVKGGCAGSEFGCCPDGETPSNADGSNCLEGPSTTAAPGPSTTVAPGSGGSRKGGDGDDIPELKAQKNTIASTGIVDLMLIIEDDIAKSLADLEKEYDDKKRGFEKEETDYKIGVRDAEGDIEAFRTDYVMYKRSSARIKEEMRVKGDEKATVLELWYQLKDRCVQKPESYEEKRAKRQAEIEGLKQALETLETEVAPSFMQGARSLRGLRRLS